jgi:hypothetical protein
MTVPGGAPPLVHRRRDNVGAHLVARAVALAIMEDAPRLVPMDVRHASTAPCIRFKPLITALVDEHPTAMEGAYGCHRRGVNLRRFISAEH